MSRYPKSKTVVRQRPTFRPWLESLEDRLVPSNVPLLTPTPALKLDNGQVATNIVTLHLTGKEQHALLNLSGVSLGGDGNDNGNGNGKHRDGVVSLFGNDQLLLTHGTLQFPNDAQILALLENAVNEIAALDRLFGFGDGNSDDNGSDNGNGSGNSHGVNIPPGQQKKEGGGVVIQPTPEPVIPVHVSVAPPPENLTSESMTASVAMMVDMSPGGGGDANVSAQPTSAVANALNSLARLSEDSRLAIVNSLSSGPTVGQGGDMIDSSQFRKFMGLSPDGAPAELDDTTELTTLTYNLDVSTPSDAVVADDLARSLLTGRARADLLPQQGSSVASAANLLGSDAAAPRGEETHEASPLQQFLINPLHATPPAQHAAPSAPTSRHISHAREWEKFLVRWSPLLLAPLVGWVTTRIRRANDKVKQIA
jgi:hypothetical protein